MDTEFCEDDVTSSDGNGSPKWRYNEMKACGHDYNDKAVAALYDTNHQMFRNYEREAERIVAAFHCARSATVLDMGCGTGAFAIHAARHYRTVHAVDVSEAMLQNARDKADTLGLSNIVFHQSGFLTYEHKGEPVDAINTVAALHHLPDMWKLVGLHRLASMLKPRGRLHLFDVVFSFDVRQYEARMTQFVQTTGEQMGPSGRAESQTHLRDEYSTCDWIMEGLLDRAGFEILKADYMNPFLATYLCEKKGA